MIITNIGINGWLLTEGKISVFFDDAKVADCETMQGVKILLYKQGKVISVLHEEFAQAFLDEAKKYPNLIG